MVEIAEIGSDSKGELGMWNEGRNQSWKMHNPQRFVQQKELASN